MAIYKKSWDIDFMQCYPNGFLKYTELCIILQLTGGEHAALKGFSLSDMQIHDQAWVLSQMRVVIHQLPKWKDRIVVKTWISSIKGARSTRMLEVYLNDEKIIESITVWVVFNTKIRKPELLKIDSQYFVTHSDTGSVSDQTLRIAIDEHVPIVMNKKVALSDLDIVNHVNNVKYLEWCLDLVDYNLILKQKIRSFDMNFMRELRYHDSIVIGEKREEKKALYAVIKDGKAHFALQLYWN